MSAHAVNPYQPAAPAASRRFLYGLNPLSKVGATLPVMVAVLFMRDVYSAGAAMILGIVLLLVGARPSARTCLFLLVGLPLFLAVLSVSFGVWTDAATVADTAELVTIGSFTFYAGALETGAATALRLGAVIVLALISGVTTAGPDLVRSTVHYLRVPYRVGYTVLAAYRFVPRFGYELGLIRQAHRVRGMGGGRGPLAAARRAAGYVIPLMAGAIRHAERVALAMDSRAFGAHPTRTERHQVPWRTRDTVFLVVFLAANTAILVAAHVWV